MSEELDRLRADLELLERLWETVRFEESAADFYRIKSKVRDKIAQLEAEQADPWRGVATIIRSWATSTSDPTRQEVAKYVDHLTAENDRLAARVAELEADSFRRQAVIKQANELCVNDVIVDGGMIRTVTGVTFEEDQYKVVCGGAIRWYDKGNSVAVVPGPLAVASPDPDDPILDPARVLKTAVNVLDGMFYRDTAKRVREYVAVDAKPYRLKGSGVVG